MKSKLVSTTEGVVALAARLRDLAGDIAVDTEADSLHHYRESLCLIQLSAGGENYLVDPLAGAVLSPLLDVLSVRRLLFHGADYDLRLLQRDFGFRATSIFDTMTAAQLLGCEQIGYAALVESRFGVTLCKKAQKADWSVRPLPDLMQSYAADDVIYLGPLAERLAAELAEQGRLAWHVEMCARHLEKLEQAPPPSPEDDEKKWRVRGWHRLKQPRAWAVLRELWHWRECEAERADRPPFKVIRNESLVELAEWAIKNGHGSPPPEKMLPRNMKGRRLRTLTDALERGLDTRPEDWPRIVPVRSKLPPVDGDLLEHLRRVRNALTADLKLDPGVLAPKQLLEAIARYRPKSEAALRELGEISNWQADLVAKPFLETVRAYEAGELAPVAPAGRAKENGDDDENGGDEK